MQATISKPHPNIFKYNGAMLNYLYTGLAEKKNLVLLQPEDVIDILDIMAISDVLITDISAASSEFLIFDKPLIFYDHPGIRDNTEEKWIWRCGDKVENIQELFDAIKTCLAHPSRNRDEREYCREEFFGKIEESSERAVDAIRSVLPKGKKYIAHCLIPRTKKSGNLQLLSNVIAIINENANRGIVNLIYTTDDEIAKAVQKTGISTVVHLHPDKNVLMAVCSAENPLAALFYDYCGDELAKSVSQYLEKIPKVQLFHGTSDKRYIINPEDSLFDLILIPGPRDRKRVRNENTREIGPLALDKFVRGKINSVEIRGRLGITTRKVILYAPSWNSTYEQTEKSSIRKIDISLLLKNLGSEYTLLIRPHPLTFVLEQDVIHKIEKIIIGLSNAILVRPSEFVDIVDIMSVSDMLITDVSSVSVTYLAFNRPIIYFDAQRSYTMDEKRMWNCGDVVSDIQGILQSINLCSREPERHSKERAEAATEYLGELDGRSAERALNLIMDLTRMTTVNNGKPQT